MTPDFESLIRRFFWWVPRRPAFYLSALWVGSQIGAYALAVGFYLSGAKPQEIAMLVLTSPRLYMSAWLRVNIIVMVIALYKFADLDNLDLRNWGIFTGIMSLLSMLAGLFWMKAALPLSLTWITWIFLVGALIYAVWFFERVDRNRWAVEIAMIKADNASKLARREARAARGAIPPAGEDEDEYKEP